MPSVETPYPHADAPRVRGAGARAHLAWLDRLPLPPIALRIARFLCVGLVGLGVDAGLFALLYGRGFGAPLARAISLAVATFVTWALNRAFTFGPSDRTAIVEALRYAGVALLAQGFNYVSFLLLLQMTGAAHPLRMLIASAVMTAAFSFTGQSLFAFRRAGPTELNSQR